MAASQDFPQHSYKGIDYTFVDTPVRLLDEFKCAICLQLVDQPILTSCGHLFCAKCIKSQQTYPTCRKRFTTTRDQRSERLLKAFKVQCPNSEKGCAWEGDLGDTEDHMKKNCHYQQVSCPNGCGQSIERKSLLAHSQDSCPHRKYQCPHCKEEGLYKVITKEHLVNCSSFLLDCPAKCGRRVKRYFMKHHLSTQCPEEYISCKYAVNGCDALVKRKDRKKHESDDSLHLQVLTQSQTQLLQSFTKCLKDKSWDSADVTALPLSSRPWLQNTPTCYPVPPCVVKFEQISEMEQYNQHRFAGHVYSHVGGYNFQLILCTPEDSILDMIEAYTPDIYLEISCQKKFQKPYLPFPFKAHIQVTLLNQLEDRKHHCIKLETISRSSNECKGINRLDVLHEIGSFDHNDCVFFRIDKITIKL